MKNYIPASLHPGLRLLPAFGLVWLIGIFASGATRSPAAEVPIAASPEQSRADRVEAAMKKAIDALYASQKNGNWEDVPVRSKADEPTGLNGRQWGGLTAITTYALLSAGEEEKDPRIAAAINFLVNNPSQGVYASACRCLVWSRIKLNLAEHNAARDDVAFLLKAMKSQGEAKGLFYYTAATGPEDYATYDHSVSQFAALGLSVMISKGFEIPQEFWQITEGAWQRHQHPDGSWSYAQSEPLHSANMTAAGVATLFITQNMLAEAPGCRGNAVDPHLDQGIDWLAKNFDATFDVARIDGQYKAQAYGLFAISRVGVASGRRFFGPIDWYNRGADWLIATQQLSGSWDQPDPRFPPSEFAGTQLGLLFLAYGSSPVVFSKLEYTLPAGAGKPAVPQWNQRPQDLLDFTDWLGLQLETRLNWQVVNFSSTAEVMHESPILFIAGSAALSFTDEQRAKLRQFVEEGGMIVGNADCDSPAFAESFVKLGQDVFPGYEFRELPPTHPIYTNEQYRASKFRRPARVQGLTNGVRELMLLPAGDASRAFEHHNETLRPETYQLFSDITLYAMDTSGLERKGKTYFVQENPAAPVTQTIKLARLQYAGNWDPEPGGWRRLAAVLHNTQQIALQAETVKLGDGKLITPPAPANAAPRPSDAEIRQMAVKRIPPADLAAAIATDPQKVDGMVKAKIAEVQAELDAADAARAAGLANFKIAHLTGTDALKLSDAQRQELKKFVTAGGTLIIDAAGGSTEFAASAEQMLRDVFGADAGQIETPLPADSPMYQLAGHPIDAVHYRNFARRRVSNISTPQLRGIKIGGRLAVIYSREDLSAGLVGEPVDGITGYTPASATELMSDIIRSAASNAPAKTGS